MRPQRVGFSVVLVINRVSILADFGHIGHRCRKYGMDFDSSLDMGTFLRKSHFFIIIEKKIDKLKPFTNYVYDNLTLA